MNCNDTRLFLSQVQNGGPVQIQLGPGDVNNLATTGYITLLHKDEYDQARQEITTVSQLSSDIQNDQLELGNAQNALQQGVQKTHSFSFHFEGGTQRAADLAMLDTTRATISRDQIDIQKKESRIAELIQKKSTLDRMVRYNTGYVSVTGQGIIALKDLNIRNYRASDMDFSLFVQEATETMNQLKGIADRGHYYESQLNGHIMQGPILDPAQFWSVAIGLAKLQGDPVQIVTRFLTAYDDLKHFGGSGPESRMMAAEIMTSFRALPSQSMSNSDDLPDLTKSLVNIDHDVRHHGHVPDQQSPGVSATILSGRKYDGSFPVDRFLKFNKTTKSYESAAILSVLNVPSDQLLNTFNSFRSLFNSWGYEVSEDTELSSAYLSISGYSPDDIKTKLIILLEGLHNYLEYPIVAAAILASIPTLEANETLDLMEKAYAILYQYAQGLQRSELVSLAVRMIHGIKNELVRQLDPTARLVNTPVQFTYAPGYNFFIYHRPLIIAHSSYYHMYSGLAGVHPAHGHGYGGGGFGG